MPAKRSPSSSSALPTCSALPSKMSAPISAALVIGFPLLCAGGVGCPGQCRADARAVRSWHRTTRSAQWDRSADGAVRTAASRFARVGRSDATNTVAPFSASASATSTSGGFCRVRRGQRDHRKALIDDRDGAVQDLGRRIGFGVQPAGFLALQRGLAGDGDRRAAAKAVQGIAPGQLVAQGRPVRRRRPAPGPSGRRWIAAIRSASRCNSASSHSADDHRADERLGGRDAELRPRMKVQRMRADLRQIAVGVVGQREGQRALASRHLRHAHDVGAFARLRNRQARAAGQLQRPAIDRRDRRPDRGDRHAGQQFAGVLEDTSRRGRTIRAPPSG